VWWEELQRDESLELEVPGFVHYAHAALPQLLKYLVMGNRLADHDATLHLVHEGHGNLFFSEDAPIDISAFFSTL